MQVRQLFQKYITKEKRRKYNICKEYNKRSNNLNKIYTRGRNYENIKGD